MKLTKSELLLSALCKSLHYVLGTEFLAYCYFSELSNPGLLYFLAFTAVN